MCACANAHTWADECPVSYPHWRIVVNGNAGQSVLAKVKRLRACFGASLSIDINAIANERVATPANEKWIHNIDIFPKLSDQVFGYPHASFP